MYYFLFICSEIIIQIDNVKIIIFFEIKIKSKIKFLVVLNLYRIN